MTFEELLEEHHIPVAPGGHHHVSGDWIGFDCPYCSPNSQRFRMAFNPHSGAVNCWVCGVQKLTPVLAEMLNLPLHKARELSSKIQFERSSGYAEKTEGSQLILPDKVGPLQKQHKRYLKKRGFDPDELARVWDIQGIGIAPRYSWSVFIPVHHQGTIVSWTTRSISNRARKKYESAPADKELIPISSLLYGEDYCTHTCIVHEGPTDVWRTGPGAVATLGLYMTKSKLKKIAAYSRRIICFDADNEAQKRAELLCDRLEHCQGETINIVLQTGGDAAEASEREIKELRRLLT